MTERWHGTLGGYTNHRCRCDECLTAHRLYERTRNRWNPTGMSLEEWRASVKGIPQAEHGTLTRYRKWGCRCAECRARSAAERRRWRQIARQRAS